MVCFTNPHVPERMRSLAEDGGRRYADAVRASALLLVGRRRDAPRDPLQHGARAARRDPARRERADREHGGTGRAASCWSRHGGGHAGRPARDRRDHRTSASTRRRSPTRRLEWMLPDDDDQRRVSDAILAVKVNEGRRVAGDLRDVARALVRRGAGRHPGRVHRTVDVPGRAGAGGRPAGRSPADRRPAPRGHRARAAARTGRSAVRYRDTVRPEATRMAATIYVNGRITGERDAVIPVLDHGFLYGEGVYEVMRTYNRKPFLYGAHMDAHAAVGRHDQPRGAVHRRGTARRGSGRRPRSSTRRRAVGGRGVGDVHPRAADARRRPDDLRPGACPEPTLVIIIKPQVDPPAEAYEKGVKVILVPVVRNHPFSINPLIKSNNLLNNALASQYAMRAGRVRGDHAELPERDLRVLAVEPVRRQGRRRADAADRGGPAGRDHAGVRVRRRAGVRRRRARGHA